MRGSSPRVWGQDRKKNLKHALMGIIPTRMGTSLFPRSLQGQCRDHPHAYGDKLTEKCSDISAEGSSPRVWGQVYTITLSDYSARIIPTRMGTSLITLGDMQVSEDHPHAYGDKMSEMGAGLMQAGSSPRVWGQAHIVSHSLSEVRIIPTRMGTSIYPHSVIPRRQDHPHAYGDKQYIKEQIPSKRGSSPRVWGQVPILLPP